MAPYKPIARQKRPATQAPKPKVMSPETKRRAIKIVRYTPKADVPQPPMTPTMRKGISIKQILRNRTADVINLGREIIVESEQRGKSGKGFPTYRVMCWHRDPLRPFATRRDHEVTVVGLDNQTDPISSQNKVYVSCDCEDWVFRWEYAVAKRGGTRVLYGNGDAPVMTNPTEVAGCCKHLSHVLETIMRKGY